MLRRNRELWLALLAMLFQQVALVAYACPVSATPAELQMVMADCEGTEMPDPRASALCDQHCVRDHVNSPNVKALQVPSLALVPLHFALAAALLLPVEAQYYEDVPTCRSDPPPAQRFCSLQI